MILRKSRFSFRPKKNSPNSSKDIKSSAKVRRPPLRSLKNTKNLSKRSLETPSKHEKSVFDDTLIINSSPNINLITSTPISHDDRRRITRSSTDSSGKAKLKSLNRISCPVISSPIQKSQIKSCEIQLIPVLPRGRRYSDQRKVDPCEIQLIPVLPRGKRYSDQRKVDQILKKYRKTSNNQSSLLLNSSIGISRKSVHSRSSSMTLRSHNASNKISNDVKKRASKKSRHDRKDSTKRKNTNNNLNSVKKNSIKDVHLEEKKPTKDLLVCVEKLHPTISLMYENECSVFDKSNELSNSSIAVPNGVTQASQNCSLQSCSEANNSEASRYSLRNSNISPKKLCNKEKIKDKKRNGVSPLTPKNFIPDSDKCNRMSRGNIKSHNVKLSQHSQSTRSSVSEKKEISKSSRNSLKLQNQCLSKRTSARLSSKNILKSQETNTPKNLLESSADGDDSEISIFSLELENVQPPKKTSVNKLSRNSSKKSSTKKQKLVKKNAQNEASKSSKKISSSLKKQTSSKKSTEKVQPNYLSLSENVTIDDLALTTFTTPAKRKVKSDGFKVPAKNTLKRKRSAIEAVIKADEDYEDDIYEKKDFNKFKDILLDTSDSERSFTIATPKFPCTPLMHYKTPKFKDIISPAEFAMKRKVAMEMHHKRQQKRRKNSNIKTVAENKNSETPLLAEKKKLEYSQILADAQKLQNTIESLAEDESDNDSYFSFN